MSNNFLNLENSALSKNSADCLLNLLQLNLLGANASANNSNINSGLQYGDRVGIGGGGGGGNGTALTKEQQQALFYQSRGGGSVQQQQQQQQKGSSGRAITNTGNLCNNFGQAQDIFSQSILNCGGGGSGKLNKELGEYKSNQRGGAGQDINNMGSQAKPFRNGGDGKYLLNFCSLNFII